MKKKTFVKVIEFIVIMDIKIDFTELFNVDFQNI